MYVTFTIPIVFDFKFQSIHVVLDDGESLTTLDQGTYTEIEYGATSNTVQNSIIKNGYPYFLENGKTFFDSSIDGQEHIHFSSKQLLY
jgi:hypothetical protein